MTVQVRFYYLIGAENIPKKIVIINTSALQNTSTHIMNYEKFGLCVDHMKIC